jgi:hypothetical protein
MEVINRDMYVVVTDYVKANSGEDVSDALQELILANPNRTIFFPDGEYLLSKPICTPANPVNAVSLKLATFAKLKAMDTWTEKEALVRLGAAEPYNSIYIPGSNYYFEGGIIDGNGKANGISIDSGRETAIHHVSIKNTEIGIHIKWGANNRSSDADVHSVNIVGNNSKTSVGVLLEGHDNTLTNMRIASVHVGIQADSGGNIFRNLHPLYIYAGENAEDENFLTSVAFMDRWNDNYYDICYSDQFCTAFSMQSSSRNIYTNSYIMWYTSRGGVENAFKVNGKFNSVIRTPRVNFHNDTTNALISVTEEGGSGILENPMINNEDHITDKTYKEYLTGIVVSPKK